MPLQKLFRQTIFLLLSTSYLSACATILLTADYVDGNRNSGLCLCKNRPAIEIDPREPESYVRCGARLDTHT
jgi:hypothetical protein